ncbi:TPA: hypothetical protein IQA36_002805, partial [Listeria monocytogenes]|nr:hypothetical protein [Listeria monocytogenes]
GILTMFCPVSSAAKLGKEIWEIGTSTITLQIPIFIILDLIDIFGCSSLLSS